MTDNPLRNREIIFELRAIGAIVRVSAMDTKTMTEISIQGPSSAGEPMLKATALKKLEYVMRKKGLI